MLFFSVRLSPRNFSEATGSPLERTTSPLAKILRSIEINSRVQKNNRDGIRIATPFLKWAGGKSQLLSTFAPMFPQDFGRYFEPFLGGGAVFFHLRSQHPNLSAVLSDSNQELINCYLSVQESVDELIFSLKRHRNDRHHFYRVRAEDVSRLTETERAARMIFLNKTCFNGLYRVNRKGQFNVPFGKYSNPKIVDERNLMAAAAALKNARIICAPFEAVLARASRGDFVYMDPPYQPLSTTSSFTGYTRNSFGESDQIRLAETFKSLTRRGCLVMLSNSDTPFTRSLYEGFRLETVRATRAINSKAERRGRINELVVLNY